MALTKQIIYLGDFYEDAVKARNSYGSTSLFSTGDHTLDTYLGGGFGRPGNYEIVLLYGPTGVGKSTVGLNMVASAISSGKKVGLLILEDEMTDVSNRLSFVLSEDDYKAANRNNNVFCLPQDALVKAWSLPDLLKYIEDWFIDHDVDLILLDHLQFIFEGATMAKSENEYIAQRVFMQQLNFLMKKVKKTIILVSHMNKASAAKGMDRIVGSGAIAQAATKVIEVTDDDVDDVIRLWMRKSRFTKRPPSYWCMNIGSGRMRSIS